MADKQDTKEDIVAVGPGADEDQDIPVEPGNDAAGDDYQYPEGDVDADGRGEAAAGDERTGHSEDDDADRSDSGLSREQKRRRRKREKYERDQRELNLLRARNEQLEREHSQRLASMESRQTQSDVMAIDGRIAQTQNEVREAETLFAQAIKSGDEGAIAEALRVRDELRDGLTQLRNAKQHTVRIAQERNRAAEQPATPDPAIAARAQQWAREQAAWFDPQARDEDSAIAYAVERRVFQEGRFSPASAEYWEEVNRRLARRLPEHFRGAKDDQDEDDRDLDERSDRDRRNGNGRDGDRPVRRPSGPTIKVGGRERPLRKGEVFIDEDRKQAMIEAGVWDDETERARFLKSYQKYDRDAGRRPRR